MASEATPLDGNTVSKINVYVIHLKDQVPFCSSNLSQVRDSPP